MLAGLVNAAGPYGWHGESPDLGARVTAGMGLHRWGGMPQNIGGAAVGAPARRRVRAEARPAHADNRSSPRRKNGSRC